MYMDITRFGGNCAGFGGSCTGGNFGSGFTVLPNPTLFRLEGVVLIEAGFAEPDGTCGEFRS